MPFMLPEPNELGSETLAELPERSFISALDFLPICLPANYLHTFAKGPPAAWASGERENCTLKLPLGGGFWAQKHTHRVQCRMENTA